MNSRVAEFVAIGMIAVGVRLVGLEHTPHFDEMYHVLAAEATVESGEMRIPGGRIYDRAAAFTAMVAAAFRLMGESLVAARIPSVIAGVALVLVLFGWVRALADRGAGWIAGLLLALDPASIYLSQLARFYSIHALCVLVAAICIYRLTNGTAIAGTTSALALSGTVAGLATAWHLQVTTGIALAGLTAWIALVLAPRITMGRHRLRWLVGCGALTVLAVAAVGTRTDFLATIFDQARYADLWAEGGRGNLKYYYWLLLDRYAPFVWGFPIALLAAVWRYGRAAAFPGLMFVLGIGLHSLMAWKGERYVAWLMPFFFVVVAMGLASIARWLVDRVGTARGRPVVVLGAAAIAVVLVTGGSWRYTRALLTYDGQHWPFTTLYRGEADWAGAAVELQSAAETSEILVASAAPKALYFFGRVDIGLMATELVRRDGSAGEFSSATTPLGRPMIGEPRSIESVIDCHPSGLIVLERKHRNKSWAVPTETVALIEGRTTRIDLDPRWRIDAFAWRHDAEPSACERIERVRQAVRP